MLSIRYLLQSLSDIADLALGCKSCRPRRQGAGAAGPGAEAERMGGLVLLSSSRLALEVGVLATPQMCGLLAERLLGKPANGAFPDTMVRGAICELSYLLAGGVKRRMTSAGVGTLSIGQPSRVDGRVVPKLGWQVQAIEVELDSIVASLVCVMRDDTAALF